MGKRIESSKIGYVQRAFLTRTWAALDQEDDRIDDNGIFDQIARLKRDADAYAQADRGNNYGYPARDFDVRKVRVTLIVEDITDGEAEA